MDRFEDLRTFVRVAESLSVTRAAEALERAPSAVSRRVRELEARLGTQLLTRTTRQVALTPAGERLLERARQVLADLEEAESCARDDARTLSGTLRIGAPLSFGLAHLMPVLNAFMEAHPALEVSLDLDDRKVGPAEGRLDVALRLGEIRDASLRSRRLASVRLVVAASPLWWAAHGRPADAAALAGTTSLCYSNLDRPGDWRFGGPDGVDGQLATTPRLIASNGDALVKAALAALGVVRLPAFLVNEAIASGELVPVLLDHDWGEIGLHAVYPDTRFVPARTRAFVDHCALAFGGEPPWHAALGTLRGERRDGAVRPAAPPPGGG